MVIRKAVIDDLPSVGRIYDEVHEMEEAGLQTIGWVRGVYPTLETARKALEREDLFVLEDDVSHGIAAAAIINQVQVDVYALGAWEYAAKDNEVAVLHTLVVSPGMSGKGLGREFVRFYEAYAADRGWYELRIDTNSRNEKARRMYRRLGYREVGIVPTVFNGIEGVNLVLLEKNIRRV